MASNWVLLRIKTRFLNCIQIFVRLDSKINSKNLRNVFGFVSISFITKVFGRFK